MSITWILVANASAAHLYANYGPKKGELYTLVTKSSYPMLLIGLKIAFRTVFLLTPGIFTICSFSALDG